LLPKSPGAYKTLSKVRGLHPSPLGCEHGSIDFNQSCDFFEKTTMQVRLCGSSDPNLLTVVGSTVYFASKETTNGQNILWKTDGTASGTARVPLDASNAPILSAVSGLVATAQMCGVRTPAKKNKSCLRNKESFVGARQLNARLYTKV